MSKANIFTGKNIVWGISYNLFILLIPKKRGIGYMRQPVGHHVSDLTRFLDEIEWRDMRGNTHTGLSDTCGLDGYLDLGVGGKSIPLESAKQVVKAIADYRGVDDIIQVQVNDILNFQMGI